MVSKIKFGYEVPDGKEVDIKLAHTVMTGLTQEAGKNHGATKEEIDQVYNHILTSLI